MNDLPDPTLNNWVKRLLNSVKRLDSVPIKKKRYNKLRNN